MVLLAIVASITSVKATVYYHVEIEPVLVNGATGLVCASTSNVSYLYNNGKNNLWKTHFSQTFSKSSGNPDFYIQAYPGDDKRSIFAGWYWDEDCTVPIKTASNEYTKCRTNVWGSSFGRTFTSYATAEIAEKPENVITLYAKFVKTTPAFDWTTLAQKPADGGKYYIYSPVRGCFLKAPKGTASNSNMPVMTANPSEATLFTYTYLRDGAKNTNYDDYGVKENRSYKEGTLTYQDGGQTKYASCYGASYWTTHSGVLDTRQGYDTGYKLHFWSWASMDDKTFVIAKADASSSYDYVFNMLEAQYFPINADGTSDIELSSSTGSPKHVGGIYWMLLPESAVLEQARVLSKQGDVSITINASPIAIDTTYVKFNVSATSTIKGFTYALTGGDGHFVLDEDEITLVDNVLTIPIIYTAQNLHSGSSPIPNATVTVTDKNPVVGDRTSESAIVSAYVDLEPRFALNTLALDWNRVNSEVVETFYPGMDIAASQRDRLANKLVYYSAQTTGVAVNYSTWTATIEGEDADQFKFANGTQTVTFYPYSADSLDVHYAPTTGGDHTATLHIVARYTDANSHTETYDTEAHEKNITLSGVCSNTPKITFAADGNQLPTNNESYDFDSIVGTNARQVTADLFISSLISDEPQIEWNDEHGAFVFDPSSFDPDKVNQTLTFGVHRENAVTDTTNYTATLIVSGNGGAVTATLTLTYVALPRIVPTVTWNWETIPENATVINPITTNSDGAWTLAKSVGDKITYNDEEKTATAPYVHHEPGITVEFVFHQNQTDSFAAFDKEYEAIIAPPSQTDIRIDSQEQFNTYVTNVDQNNSSYFNFDASKNELYLKINTTVTTSRARFAVHGQTNFTFTSESKYASSTFWNIIEIFNDGTSHVIYEKEKLADEYHDIPISPNVKEIVVGLKTTSTQSQGWMKNIHYFENETIATNVNPITMVYSGSAITSKDFTATFANKRKITVSLNATAAQYFEISSTGKTTDSSIVFDTNDGLGLCTEIKPNFTIALKAGKDAAQAKAATIGNACQLIFEDDYTYNQGVLSVPIVVVEDCNITYTHSEHGSYTFTYQNNGLARTVDNTDSIKTISTNEVGDYVVTLSNPTAASGYQFQGWKINNVIVSNRETFTISIGKDGSTVEAVFVQTEAQNYKVGDVYFANLDAALSAASTSSDSKVVTLLQDITLTEGSYTIPAGVTFLIPHKKDFFELQETPDLVNVNSDELELAQKLSAYRTLTLKAGVTIACNGNICVAGNMVTANGGRKSAYPTGEVGLINMVHGGHIELNDGANLYCWGYIKGQDMDQGNNTVGTGTVTANDGSVIWEDFELGDWRGGSASLDIYNNNVLDHRQLFPFQSYAIQNIEIPTTFKYGSTLRTYTSITTGMGNHGAVFAMIGKNETMFKLENSESVVRTWYDPTTDLTCYELSGTAKLDQLNVTVYVSMSSKDFILPISNSMHIILSSDLDLVNPLMVQAGSIIEIKPTATVNLTSELYLYDVDQWDKYVHDYYFRSFNNITSHKDRGAEDSKAGLDDAKLIVDGILNVNNGGKIYATAGGANVMGNNGGVINFNTSLPDSKWLWAVTVKKELPYIDWEYNDVTAANLCNEDGSYTQSTGFTSYYNIHGRWFNEEDKNEKPDHTYWFRYLSEGNAGEEEGTAAVYSHDKTGLEARMKWFNVVKTADNCTDVEDDLDKPFTSNWWIGSNPAAYYNYTMLGEWHQFIPAEGEGEGVYSGSNNVLYRKADCEWAETGVVDENCLYTFVDGEENITKKALVDGHFIPLTSNGYDPAYHQTDDASKYFICFAGCNWHPATPYVGESKAYTINPEAEVTLHYIWFNNDWLNVLRDEPFFYTEDEQTNVRTYYEYVNGDWVVATPYVSVSDEAETRTFYMIKEAFNVASIKKNATITLLRDLPNVSEVLTYTTQNTTCTLDLNGHLLGGALTRLITINAPGATFTITDNTDLKLGKISSTATPAVYVQKGALVVANGTIETTAANAVEGAASTTITINGGYFAATTKCVQTAGSCSISGGHFSLNAGLATYKAPHTNVFETTDPKYRYTVETAWTITFKKDEETTLQTLVLKPNETPVYTEAQPTKDGFKFTGWDHAIVPATEDATYMAVFEAIVEGEKCVTLNANGGVEGLRYIYVASGSAVGTLPTATKEGYTFVGWFTAAVDGDEVNASTTVSANVIWYAHYTKNSYTLTWIANGGELSGSYTSGTVEFGAAITAPTATRAGCEFLGWGVASVATTMPAHDVTYTAQWPIIAKHYLQNIDGTYPETPEATDVVSGEANGYVTPATKTYDGFITPETQTVQIGVANEVTYNYVRRTYTITLDATTNEGTCATASLEVKHGAAPVLPAATKEGRVFEGWFTKAVGGDQITNETLILRNMGTLYAQFSEASLNVTTPITISDTREVTDLRVATTGRLTITGSVTTNNFILESNGATASGQLVGGEDKLTINGNAYFDYAVNAKNHQWYAVAVPWEVDAENGISVNSRTLILGTDFDIIYYDGARRATEGKQKCWSYVENDIDKTLEPGRLYMIALMSDAPVIRFAKKAGADLLTTGTSVKKYVQTTDDEKDANWNGVANPALFHAYVNAGAAVGQVYNPANNSYDPIVMSSVKMVVGQGAFVQAPVDKDITVAYGGAFAAPRRAKAANTLHDIRIAPAGATYTDRLFIQADENKEQDIYTIGQDLVKVGVSSKVAQMWVARYDGKLCMNTMRVVNGAADYPLGISVPAAGEYTISSIEPSAISGQNDYVVYLTENGAAIWNLSESAYTLTLDKGTHAQYGVRLSAKAPQITTGIDEAVVDAQGETKKVLIGEKVYIIRGEKVYTVDGQLVK